MWGTAIAIGPLFRLRTDILGNCAFADANARHRRRRRDIRHEMPIRAQICTCRRIEIVSEPVDYVI